MTAVDPYNGWANRETWALALWLDNDQGLYEMTIDRVRDANGAFIPYDNPGADDSRVRCWAVGEAVQNVWDELTDPEGDFAPLSVDIIRMIIDVGSVYRIDWDEIGRHWLDRVTEDAS